jgi:CheY-like chemotaxis protein
MPGTDGKTVLSFIKSHPIFRSIPAVMYTSSLRQVERQQCLQLGADDYIVKPASLKDCEGVVHRIRELLHSA